jgi:hypothetical protein
VPPTRYRNLELFIISSSSMDAIPQVVHMESGWSVWFDENSDQKNHLNTKDTNDGKDSPTQHDFLERMVKAGSCNNYESFRNIWRQLCDGCGEPPAGTNIRIFRDGLKPLWEDPANVDGGKFVICIGSKDGGSEKFLAMVSALLAGDLSDAQNLNGAVLSSRSWGHTLSLWHGTAKPGDRAAQMLESELRALVDEVSISFHQHRKTLIYHSARGEELREVPEEYKNPAKLPGAAPPRVAPRMSLRQRKSGVLPVKTSLTQEMARLEARWSSKEMPPVVEPKSNILVTWSATEISAAIGAAIIAVGLIVCA